VLDLATEKQLIEQAKHNRQQFGVLFDAYYPAIAQYALRRTGDAAAAQDITAETFYKAMIAIPKFRWQGVSISNWLYKIATNEIRMYFRRSTYQPASLDALFADGFEVADEYDFTQEIVAAQDAVDRGLEFARAQAILATLPTKYQEVIMLRFGEKKKLREIALILHKRPGTVKSLLSRGLSKLKLELEQQAMQPNPDERIVPSEGHVLLTSQEAYED
jgi:RNA polymerase sigma-70 factor (ECF subfamily)